MKKSIQIYWLFIIALFLGACANVVTPGGGPRDVTPPVVLKTIPNGLSKEFKSNSVRIDFDEYVKITDASSQIVVSPFMKEAPTVKLRGKSIVVDFNDSLKPNTTYSVSFGKAISDINEGNVLLDYRYVCSTGSIIDSLTLKGSINDALSLKSQSGIYVMLYEKDEDSIPYKETPFYISKTGESGYFNFYNLKKGKYKLFAIKDGNSNFIYDQLSEKIAFSDTLVTPEPIDTARADSIRKNNFYNLFLFEELPVEQRLLKSAAVKYGKLLLLFRKPVEQLSITPLVKNFPSDWCMREFNKSKDSVTLWLKYPDLDSIVFQIKDGQNILDTAEISLLKKATKQSRGRGEELKFVNLSTSVSANGKFDFYKSFLIECSVPLAEHDFTNVILAENKDTIKPDFVFTDSVKRFIRMDHKWKEDALYSLLIPPGAVKDIFGLPNDTLKINFRTTALKDYGNVKLNIKSTDIKCNLIVQLVTETDCIVQEKFSVPNQDVKLPYVSPGNYRIKVICDINGNNKWDTGDYLKKIQPEKVYYYPAVITIKANWDNDLEMEMTK